ncbi:MAG: hypothetical protein IKS94_10190 [Prevotella sp.]|nr:hypothetical protein [Prevotella sp.]
MKRILTTIALAATISFTTMAQVNLNDKEYLHPREDGKIELLFGPDFYSCESHNDTTMVAQLYREWGEYTRQHPTDGIGWRNYSGVLQTYWMKRGWGEESQKARINYAQRLRESIPDTYTYYYMMIHYSSVEDPDDNGEKWALAKYKYACKAMDVLPDDVTNYDMNELISIMMDNRDTLRTNKLLFELYDRRLISPNVLQYHFNELQGMPDSALYLGNGHGDIIPKLIIQNVMGLHRDKVFYNQGICFNKDYNAQSFKSLGVPELDFDKWLRIHGTWSNEDWDRQFDWNKEVVQHLCNHSPRPVYFSANGLSSDWLTDSLRARLYNEGLTLRYSATPYDNFAVKRRNIDQRYLLEYLLYEFQKPKNEWHRGWRWGDSENDYAENYIKLFKDQLPWYKKNDREGYLRLGRLFFRIMVGPWITTFRQMADTGEGELAEGKTMQDLEKALKELEDIEKNRIEEFLKDIEDTEKKAKEADKNAETPTKQEKK